MTQTIDDILEAAEKATPGDWEQSHREKGVGFSTQVYTPDGETICTLHWYPMPKINGSIGTYRPHNARLIAGAPQLAAEVRRLREREEVLTEALGRIRDSGAAKFKGEYNHVQIAKDALAIPSTPHQAGHQATDEAERGE